MDQSRISPVGQNDDGSVFDDDEFSAGGKEIMESLHDDEHKTEIARDESRAVFAVRILVLVLLIAVTAGVAWAVYYYVSSSETKAFQDDFRDSSDKVLDSLGSAMDRSLGAIDSLAVAIVSHQESSGSVWPNVTLPHFGVVAQKIITLSKASVIGFYPRVNQDQRKGWEAYVGQHDYWVNESLKTQRENPSYKGANILEWSPYPVIQSNTGIMPPEEKYYPTWQASPVVPRYSAYGWDLHNFYSPELNIMETNRVVIMGRSLNVHNAPGDDSDSAEHESTINWISDLIGIDQDPSDPLFPFYYPVVENMANAVDASELPASNDRVVGAIGMTIFWRELIKDTVSSRTQGVIVVVGSDCNQTFTYQINGPDAVYLGKGDLHDPSYDKYRRKAYLHELESNTVRTSEAYNGFPLSATFCPYWVEIYPSDTMLSTYETKNPTIFTVVAVSIFIFTSVVFLVYDCVSENRQKKVLQVAIQSSAVVSNLFPQAFRERLFPSVQDKPKERIETAKLRLKQFLRNDEEHRDISANPTTHDDSIHDKPIAELFSETTVMFADIAGFTAWSSIREPAQVFTLLETLYSSFDRIAARRGVFKVETIGDSYVAVAGLPEPRTDHALVMAKFARDVREKMVELSKKLGTTLGPDTADLQLRIGLNSGPVTAGVLRGERSRFQLFGDTVNTAARMESTGIVSKIHISQTTADKLILSGKSHWVTKREGGVEAKGKGRVQTYWAEPNAKQVSVNSSETSCEKPSRVIDEKTRRLVDWNVEIMKKILKQIILRREVRRALPVTKEPRQAAKGNVASGDSAIRTNISIHGTPLDGVKEVIMLPKFDRRLATNAQNPASIILDTEVMTQLHRYISMIAGMYRDNPFHSFEHASHVTMSVVKLLSRIVDPNDQIIKTAEETNEDFVQTLHDHTYGITSDPLTQFSCVFSALIHDVDHPGVPNSQLIKEESPLNATYNGKSLAEQNSVDIAWRLFMEDQFDDLRAAICASVVEMGRFRQLVVNGVMATDIMDKDLKNLRDQRWDKAFQEQSRVGECIDVNINRKATIVIEHLIQASDVAHTMQHWHIFRKWNERLFLEMYNAYRAGRAETNPAEFWYKGEIGFFDFYIIPLARKLKDCGVFGVSSDEYLNYALTNREEWRNRGEAVVEEMLAQFDVNNQLKRPFDKVVEADVKDDDVVLAENAEKLNESVHGSDDPELHASTTTSVCDAPSSCVVQPEQTESVRVVL